MGATTSGALDFSGLAQNQASPANALSGAVAKKHCVSLATLTEEDRQLVRDVLDTIISGQELDLKRFTPVNPPKLAALETDAELDDYTWRVAGCVGEF